MKLKNILYPILLVFSMNAYSETESCINLNNTRKVNLENCTNRAKQGDALSQSDLADMYHLGYEENHNYKEALMWYEKSANQGNVLAQIKLADMHRYGRGTTRNPVLAYMYYSIAAKKGGLVARVSRDFTSKKMTLSQIKEAQRLAQEWIDSH